MQLSFRWYGPRDPVSLRDVAQIPGVEGVVTSLHHLPPGAPWTRAALAAVCADVDRHGLRVTCIESLPVHEDVKLGRPTREALLDAYAESLEAVGEAGIPVVCYNFMPVFDWTRTDMARPYGDGSTSLAYAHDALGRVDLSRGTAGLPGWSAAFTAAELGALRAAYAQVDEARLWDHLAWFLERAVPAAERAGVRLALHPDDPPWPILGLPRIATSTRSLERVCALVDSPANGVTFCTGSLGADPEEAAQLPEAARRLGPRIAFAHLRNVATTSPRAFHETAHPEGDVNLPGVVRALVEAGFTGPLRPDHGRMIWGEGEPGGPRPDARAGYGLYDRALGATYLLGLLHATLR